MIALDTYLEGPPPGYALLLAGDWGVGKSFFWSRYKEGVSRFNLTPIGISAAGLQTAEDLERNLFQASISGLGSPALREAGTVIGRALLRLVKVDPDDIQLKADATGGRTVICIDDVERFAGDFRILFGFIVGLIDGKGVHCILIADEEKAIEEFVSYNKYKERIVGKTLRLVSDLKYFCGLTVQGFSSKQSRDVLLSNLDDIVDSLQKRNISNLRTARFVLTEMDGVIRRLPSKSVGDSKLPSLLRAIIFWAIASTKSAENSELVAKVFSTAELGVALALHEHANDDANAEGLLSRVLKLLEETKFSDIAYEWPESQAFVNLIEGKEVDFFALATDFGLGKQETVAEEDPLTAVQHYRQLSDSRLRIHIAELFDQVNKRRISDLAKFFETYRILYWLAKNGLMATSEAEWTEMTLQALAGYDPATITSGELEFWMGPYDENEQRVIGAMTELFARVTKIRKEKERIEARVAILRSNGPMPDSTSGPLFSDVSPDEVFAELSEQGQTAVLRLQKFFRSRMRIVNAPDFVGGDRDFAEALANLIERNVPFDPPISIAASLMRELAKILRDFTGFVDAYRNAH